MRHRPLIALAATAAVFGAGASAAHAGPSGVSDRVSPTIGAPFSPTFVIAPEGSKDKRVRLSTTCRSDSCSYKLATIDGSARRADNDYRRAARAITAYRGQDVSIAVRLVIPNDGIDERDESFSVQLTQELTTGTQVTKRTARATVLIPGTLIDVARPCAVCIELPAQQPAVTPPIPDPGPQAVQEQPAVELPTVDPETSSPAPSTDPAPSYDPALATRLERLTGISVSGAASAGPVVR